MNNANGLPCAVDKRVIAYWKSQSVNHSIDQSITIASKYSEIRLIGACQSTSRLIERFACFFKRNYFISKPVLDSLKFKKLLELQGKC